MSAQLPEVERWGAWDCFLQTTPDAGFMQSSWWAMFRAQVGYECFAVTLKDHNTIVGGALVGRWLHAPERCFYYVQDGPVLPRDPALASEVFDTILARIDAHRKAEPRTVSHLRIEPRWVDLPAFVHGFRTAEFQDSYTEPRDTLCIDLRGSDDEILAQMKPKGRYNVRVARRHGVTVVEDTSQAGLADFVRIQRRTARRQGIETKPASYFRTLMSTQPGDAAASAPPRRLSLFFAEYAGRRIAAALVVFFGPRATYFFGGSLALHRRVMAPYLLHFEIMRAASAAGCEWYDLWGIAPADQPEHPWQDISAFKRKFGGRELNLVPTLDYVYDSAAYDRYLAQERLAE